MAEHYQPNPYNHHKKERKSKEVRVGLPHFHGSNEWYWYLSRLGDKGWTVVWVLPCEWGEKSPFSHP